MVAAQAYTGLIAALVPVAGYERAQWDQKRMFESNHRGIETDMNMRELSKQEITAALQKIKLIADAVKDAGSIPSGHLYAVVMSAISLSEYEKIIGLLKRSELISETANVLTWRGES